jgi:hypothetical protein
VSELGEVREELGAERVRRQIAEERTAALEAELETLREVLEPPGSPDPTDTPKPDQGEFQAATQHHQPPAECRSWWRRMFGS